jgi:TolA-binding protein
VLASSALPLLVLLARTGAFAGPVPAADSNDPVDRDWQQGFAAYKADRLDEAERLLRGIWADHPKHKLAAYAEPLLLDILIFEKRTQELRAMCEEIRYRARGVDPDFPDQFVELEAYSYEIDARDHEARREFGACGRAYLDAFRSSQLAKQQRLRLTRAASCFEEGRLSGPALHSWMIFLQTDPRGPELANALYMTGRGFYRLSHLSKAADYLEQFARSFPRDARAPAALETAFQIHVGLVPDAR